MKWEYETISFDTSSDNRNSGTLIEMLNRMGSDGWELVCFKDIYRSERYIFKRPKELD